mgnify:CR=1 FL=1
MDRKELSSIGEVSKLFHISVSSLRHYENVGLLHSEYTPPDALEPIRLLCEKYCNLKM